MNSVGWFGHFPHRQSVGLSVGLLRAAAGRNCPARAFLNLQIRELLPPAPCRLIPDTGRNPRHPARVAGQLSVTLYNLSPALIVKPIPHTKGRQPKGRRPTPNLPHKHRADCLRQTALPVWPTPRHKAASLKAGGQPRAFTPSTGQIAYRQTALRLMRLPQTQGHPRIIPRVQATRKTAGQTRRVSLVQYEAEFRETPYIYIILSSAP